MSGDLYALIGVVFAAVCTLVVGIRGSKTGDRSASAAEVEKLGERLDRQARRIDELERRERFYVVRTWQLERVLLEHDLPIPDPPPLPDGQPATDGDTP